MWENDEVEDYEANEEGLLYCNSELTLDALDDANVPVDIWLDKNDDNHELLNAGYQWRLRCGNYMPRRGRVEEGAIEVYAKEKKFLQDAVEKYILPLYQVAVSKLHKMISTGEGNLYYWDNED